MMGSHTEVEAEAEAEAGVEVEAEVVVAVEDLVDIEFTYNKIYNQYTVQKAFSIFVPWFKF